MKAAKWENSPQWKFAARGTGVNFDHEGFREQSIFSKCPFDLERRRSRPTDYEYLKCLQLSDASLATTTITRSYTPHIHEIKMKEEETK